MAGQRRLRNDDNVDPMTGHMTRRSLDLFTPADAASRPRSLSLRMPPPCCRPQGADAQRPPLG
jgi:hypothetical protein